MGSVELRSKSMNLRSEGALQLNSSNHNIETGDYTINANKTIKMSENVISVYIRIKELPETGFIAGVKTQILA